MIDIKKTISLIKFPKNNNLYYERDSADGYAFLGYAKCKVGLDPFLCYEAIEMRNFSLYAEQKILNTHVPKEAKYVYTLWPCVEFLLEYGHDQLAYNLVNTLDVIGRYDNGMMKYCSVDIEYIVPNATSAAALLYVLGNRCEETKDLVDVLRNEQIYGNWRYKIPGGKYSRYEDPFHLAMMVYHLREIEIMSGIKTSDMVDKSIEVIKKYNRKNIYPGSIGWGIPMLYVAIKGIDKYLEHVTLSLIHKKYINNSNFRVRGYSAWALTKGSSYGN